MKWKNISTEYESELDRIKVQTAYERLGVTQDSTIEEVKKAYRKKIRIYHPDRTDAFMLGYSEEVTKLLNTSFEQIKRRLSDAK